MDQNNSETQDNVDTATTENNSVDSQEHEEQQEQQVEAGKQTSEEELSEEEQAKQKQEQRKFRSQKRVEEAIARAKAAEARAAELEAKLNAPAPVARPKVDDFESYEEYQDALEAYQIEKAEQKILEKLQKEQSQKSEVERQAAFESAVSELQDEGVDVEGLMKKAETLPPLPVTLDQFGLSAKEALTLAADLLQNEELYHELAGMNPYQASMRIGQIIGSKQSKPAAPPVQKAPKPINPVQANAPVKRSAESMSDQEFLKSRGL